MRVFFGGITSFGLGLVIKFLMGHVVDARFAAVGGEIPFDGMGEWTVAKSIGLDARLRRIAWLRKSIGTGDVGKNRLSGKKKPQR